MKMRMYGLAVQGPHTPASTLTGIAGNLPSTMLLQLQY